MLRDWKKTCTDITCDPLHCSAGYEFPIFIFFLNISTYNFGEGRLLGVIPSVHACMVFYESWAKLMGTSGRRRPSSGCHSSWTGRSNQGSLVEEFHGSLPHAPGGLHCWWTLPHPRGQLWAPAGNASEWEAIKLRPSSRADRLGCTRIRCAEQAGNCSEPGTFRFPGCF